MRSDVLQADQAVLVGDTPLDVLAAREDWRASRRGGNRLRGARRAEGVGADALLQDLSDTDAAIRAITST